MKYLDSDLEKCKVGIADSFRENYHYTVYRLYDDYLAEDMMGRLILMDAEKFEFYFE